MSNQTRYDGVVVGDGPNGLAAVITLARVGRSVAAYEAAETIGGGSRAKELTLPGFLMGHNAQGSGSKRAWKKRRYFGS